MQIIVRFDMDGDIIDVPQIIADNITKYQDEFLEWLFNDENDHEYWFYENGEKFGCSYRSEAFVGWLNEYPLKEIPEKATVSSSGVPHIFF